MGKITRKTIRTAKKVVRKTRKVLRKGNKLGRRINDNLSDYVRRNADLKSAKPRF